MKTRHLINFAVMQFRFRLFLIDMPTYGYLLFMFVQNNDDYLAKLNVVRTYFHREWELSNWIDDLIRDYRHFINITSVYPFGLYIRHESIDCDGTRGVYYRKFYTGYGYWKYWNAAMDNREGPQYFQKVTADVYGQAMEQRYGIDYSY